MVAGAILAMALLVVWIEQRSPKQVPPLPAPPVEVGANSPKINSAQKPPTVSVLEKTNDVREAPGNKLENAISSLKSAADAATAKRILAELHEILASMPTNAAVDVVRQLLDSKTDAATHLGFKVASNGLLDDAPTLRTFLLDELGRLDPAAAAAYSKTILASKDSPDEWAVALRNLARGGSGEMDRSLLQEKTGEMIQYSPWQQDPSVGFLEAFDAAVYLGGTNLMPALSDLVKRQDNPAVVHAAFLALDRLVINDPATTLAALQAAPDLMQGREATRANYFARADVRDPQQKQLLENYLLNPQINGAEIDTFAGIYPNANFMISANLLTQNPSLDHASLMTRDAESLRVVQAWLTDPRFANLQPALTKIMGRLQAFAGQAGATH